MSESLKDQQTWHKALVLAFRKLGVVEMLITDADIEPLNHLQPDDMPAMVAASADDGLHLILVTAKEAREFQATVPVVEEPRILVPH
jgi:hypothetical protein